MTDETTTARRYPEPKLRELSEDEKAQMRERISAGEADIYKLAEEFGCTSSQVAGIKAAMHGPKLEP
jgi:transposase-like protein